MNLNTHVLVIAYEGISYWFDVANGSCLGSGPLLLCGNLVPNLSGQILKPRPRVQRNAEQACYTLL